MGDLNGVFWSTLNRYYSLKEDDDNKDNPKCVICHRKGSSVFSIEAEENRKLIATCENKHPCSIEIIIPPFRLLTKELNEQTKKIDALQNKIIEIKNDLIFGFLTEQETVQTFQQLKTELNEAIVKSEQLFQLLVDLKPDEMKIKEYKRERDELIALCKSSVAEYRTTGSIQFLERAINIHKDIMVKNAEIMKSSYIQNNVEEEKGQYKLIQRELPIDSIEIIDGELVKNADLNKYVQSDTVLRPTVLGELEHELGEEMEEEMEPVLKPDVDLESQGIKIKIVPDESTVLDTVLDEVNREIENGPKISDKVILKKYVMNFFFKKEEGRCLTNFWGCDITIDNREYSSGECCFHGEKFYRIGMLSEGKRKDDLLKYSQKFLKGNCKEKGEAVKKQGKGFILTSEELEMWKETSIDVQREICKYKYDNYEEVKAVLCESNKILVHPAMRASEEKVKNQMWEGKAVVVDGKIEVIGQNMLGNIWMELRLEC